jgi:hypothetical protein
MRSCFTDSRIKTMTVNTPSAVPKGKMAHCRPAIIKQNRWFFHLDKNRPAVVIMAFFLFCSTMVAENSEESRKSLKGISGFYVSVKQLDQAIEKEGLTTSQIRSDVELRLGKAGIKVFTKEQASQTPGIPLLGVDLAIGSKQGLYPYALDIGARQIVRLERDPTITVYANTWSVGSAGIAGLSSVRDIVKDLLDEFINAWLSVNPKR